MKHKLRSFSKVPEDNASKGVFILMNKTHHCTDCSCMCNCKDFTCWQRLHELYIPCGLFRTPSVLSKPFASVRINRGCDLYIRQQKAIHQFHNVVEEHYMNDSVNLSSSHSKQSYMDN